MTIAKMLIIIDMLGSYILHLAPCRTQIFSAIGVNRKTTTVEHTLMTVLIVSLTCLFAILFPEAEKIESIIGGI